MPDFNLSDLPPQVMAYYHPFFGTPDGPTGRWLTWNEPLWLGEGYGMTTFDPPEEVKKRLQHDPEVIVGPGRRANYSAYYPTLGLYDTLDPTALERHARWAVEASLDGLLWDYQMVGEDNCEKGKPLQETIYDRSMRVMLEVLGRDGMPLYLCPLYDSYCWYGYSVERIARELAYLVETYHEHPRMLHFDGRLVVYAYSTLARHSIEDWRRIREMLEKEGFNRRLFLVGGEVNQLKPDFDAPGLFDGFCQYNYGLRDWSPDGVRQACEHLGELARRNGARFWSPTVGPGFDGRTWHHPGRVVSRGLGKLYEAMWREAIAAQPQAITICSFNEWGEGTQIEPCQEYEDLYLKLTAGCAGKYRGSGKRTAAAGR